MKLIWKNEKKLFVLKANLRVLVWIWTNTIVYMGRRV